MTESIAGHEFDLNGICRRTNPECSLPHRKMSEILGATKEHIGNVGWSHTGALNESELAQIEKKRAAIWAAHDSR